MTTLAAFETMGDLLLVVIGFGLIIFVHELGHFLAAKWAGIRVLAFAIGFGQSLVSYRKGLGVRRGSSEQEYNQMLAKAGGDASKVPASPTEYRLNWLPLGGYVKMLGQEDLNPGAVSEAPDSYQNTKPWKRMVVISSGVVMNIITAAILFVIVFSVGLKTEPATVGGVFQGMPASRVAPINAGATGVSEPGLMAGDVITELNGTKPESFNDVFLAAAMSRKGDPLRMTVERDGVAQPLQFEIPPERSRVTGLMGIGIEPARSSTLIELADPNELSEWNDVMARLGLDGVQPGMTIVGATGIDEVRGFYDLLKAAKESDGHPIDVTFESPTGERVTKTIAPVAQLEESLMTVDGSVQVPFEHLLGLTPVMQVGPPGKNDKGYEKGLREGDVFVRLGDLEYPSIPAGRAEILRHKGETLALVVRRGNELVELTVGVSPEGLIGFTLGDTGERSALLSVPPKLVEGPNGGDAHETPASGVIRQGGLLLTRIGDRPVANFDDIRAALLAVTESAYASGQGATVELMAELPIESDAGQRPTETIEWTLAHEDLAELHELGWQLPMESAWSTLFQPEQTVIIAKNPIDAVGKGIGETHRVMMTTYLTFLRLFEGTVKVEHLKGPVGIAHLGTKVAERGFIWLLFFLALISVNLAVINFLPLPILDGGQFIMLVYEQVRGRPMPVSVQNAATLAGLALIGSIFLLVTFYDVKNLIGL